MVGVARVLPGFFTIALGLGCANPAAKEPAGASVPPAASTTAPAKSSSASEPRVCTNGLLGPESTTVVPVRGTLRGSTIAAPDGVDAAVSKPLCDAYPKLRACFEAALSTKGVLEGIVGAKFTFDHGGALAGVEVDVPHFGDPPRRQGLMDCVTAAYRPLPLAVPAGTTEFVYMLRFTPPKVRGVSSIESPSAVVGKLPSEIVWRIVRAAIPQFRGCYEDGIAKEPTLAGMVTTSFVIGEKGNVESATAKPSTLTDPAVQACLRAVYLTLIFPEPEKGKVTVIHPIEFTSGP